MIPLNVLGIMGSPRKGNSEYLLKRSIAAAVSFSPATIKSEIYSFKGKRFEPCLGCNHCIRKNGECVHKDNFKELREKWLYADVVIYSLPVYHMSMPGQVKCFIDRLGNSLFGSHRIDLPDGSQTLAKQFKIIGTIAQGIHLCSGQEHTITDMINHALIMQSIPVTGDMWEAYIGAAGWTKNLIERDALERLVRENDMSALAVVRAAESLGLRAVETASVVLAGLLACRESLEKNPQYAQIFNRLDLKARSVL